MKSTEPLSLSTKNFNLEPNSTTPKNQQDGPLTKPELVTKEMVETSSKVESNGCDNTTKHTVEVHVHQVNGYNSDENDSSTSLAKQKFVNSSSVPRSGGDVMNGKSSVNNGLRSQSLGSDCTKPNLTSRDSAVFDVDLTTGDEINYFEEITSSKSDLGVKQQQTPVKINGVSLVNGGDKHSQDNLRREEIKTVSAEVEQKQKNGSIFSANGLRDSLKNMKKSIVGSKVSNGVSNKSDHTISSSDGVLKNGVSQGSGNLENGFLQGSGNLTNGVPQGSTNMKTGVSQGDVLGVAKFTNGSHLAKASSLESLSDNGVRFERDSELRRSKSSINGFCSGRSRSDPEEDLDELLLPGGRRNNEGFDNLPVDSGVESAASSWDRMAEVKECAHARLQEELRRAYHKLKLKDEEVSRLSRIRNEVEAELEELTASLFQEAHNMVREANVQQAAAEKSLKESYMQIDVLTAEVAALKTLVLTSTPSRPNPHLHPQIDPKSKDEQSSNGSGLFRKQHRRSPSHFNLKYGRENSPPDSPAKEPKVPQNPADTNDNVDMLEVDPNFHRDFLAWKQSPSLRPDDPFIAKVFREDIDGCLEFNNGALAQRVRESINSESICIEAVNEKSRSQFPMKCALLEVIRQCHYRMKFDGCDQTYCISQLCRNRITAVCNFLNYLRYIQRGLVKSSAHEMYWEIARLRKEIALARLGLTSNQ
ncbi:hypothetical protein LSTR_LSTR000519 [Laodelphax striatellus]|uniref:GDP/GTP exchange factor Sec2 N-terminal domain-containing protein n=1 Tax=Laodelphax striatellus TaxID=195883 RepID=A0A482WZX0_LAOST|nr:hypothetical protein LSTR_LSTR000519 [Laodelphax striatellus]